MINKIYLFLTATLLVACSTTARSQTANDHIFPPSSAAKPYIDFDSKGFLIDGKRTFIVSAGLEYARIPHQLWHDRLLRIKRAGFNCIEIYTIWNFHEPQEGKFDFTGDHDLDRFLKEVRELGMYAIVRVGPYYCAEWDNGGYPIWLKFKKGLKVREHNEAFEKYVDRFFDKLLPIVMSNQVNKGGAVVLVQLENEHPKGWGTIMPDDYFKHLQTKALSMGLQVPYFFSGLHHDSDPAGNGKLDDATRLNPWFSTEFWSVWYSQYGAKPGDAQLYDRRTWKIIANGGNGYNYYMVHGGSNFGYTNNDEDAASYDYGAAIGQTGDLRPIYYAFKRAAWFTRSFEDVLENSLNDSAAYGKIVAEPGLKISARKSPAGEIVFLDNMGKETITAQLHINDEITGNKVTVLPGEIYPLIHDHKINSEVTLNWALTRVFAIVKQDNTTTIITDAEDGSPLSLYFKTRGKALSENPSVKINGENVSINQTMHAVDKPLEYTFKTGTQTIRVLAMNRQQTDKTYIDNINGKNYIVGGTAYLGEADVKGAQFIAETERPLLADKKEQLWIYTDQSSVPLTATESTDPKLPLPVALNNWQFKKASDFAAVNYNAGKWLSSKDPVPMGADGDVTADAWYRTTLTIPVAGKYTLQVKGGGRGQAFIDGKPAAKWKLNDGELTLNLKRGKHTLAIFAAHDGRDKLAAYLGPIDEVDSKGVFGKALIKKGGPFISELSNWYFAKANKITDVKQGPPAFDTTVFKPYKIGADVFNLKEGFAWFTANILQQPVGTSKIIISFKSVDENATIFINGKQVFKHDGWNQPFEVDITDAATLKAPIALGVFIENYSNEGGIDQPVKVNAIGNAQAVTNWQMKGGPGDALAVKGWQKMITESKRQGPIFYRSSFSVPQVQGKTFIWRFEPKGLGHGSVWVNGHNIGRYPEKIAITSLYIPECWLNAGQNQLVIYDEDGKLPNQTTIVAEPEAGRTVTQFNADLK
ncbi:beta-galactosidase [Mucilaginibacter sp. FT3.2]|uniref:beta-galactosidase n=1 Tax=Mucilaginibacter sp. FT3.2 TaxID=2723090 RepID=UPI0016182862|nr:beta-galactosidase [Mucilaginibacter sp. FT3.2]MBB6230372.1 beta-galactosidase [Mucilaginibacter sp. FT3.2]